jgi:site-specific DNA-methyltransferase (adenine-specific)
MTVREVLFEDGVAILGSFPDPAVLEAISRHAGPLPLVIADPPYGNIVGEEWDRVRGDDHQFARWMFGWTNDIARLSLPGAALYVWGGVGRMKEEGRRSFRPYFRYLADVENHTPYSLPAPITWAKKRGYGIQWSYLFAREEVAYLVLGDAKKPRRFEVPLLDEKRGYAGYNAKYPAKSEYLRRTTVWTDVTEILRGKVHVNQKPEKLYEIPILAHTERGEWVLDPFAGSGTAAFAARKHGRRFVIVEQDPETFEKTVSRIQADDRTDIGRLIEQLGDDDGDPG